MKVPTVKFTELFGTQSSGTVDKFDVYNSSNITVNPEHSITQFECCERSDIIDGIRVTYKYADGSSGTVEHGTFRTEHVHDNYFSVSEKEYICAVAVSYEYVDATGNVEGVTELELWKHNIETKESFRAGRYGRASRRATVHEWHMDNHDGKVYVFAAREQDNAQEAGLKGLAFGSFDGQVTLADSAEYPPTDDSQQARGQEFDDIKSFGNLLKFSCPIKSIDIWSDKVIEGIQVTYNLDDGDTKTEMHGSVSGAKQTIELSDTESIVEIKGLHGEACPDTDWGDRINLLDFKIYDAETNTFRNAGTFGKVQKSFKQSTRKDICVRGPIVGVAGTADNGTERVGLGSLKFYTLAPPWKSLSARFLKSN